MKYSFYKYCFVVISIILFMSSKSDAQFKINRSVIASGGASLVNTVHNLKSTVGQLAVESASNSENQIWSGFWNVNLVVVDVDDDLQPPIQFELFQNYPNPFNPSTKIKYSLPEVSQVRLEVFNILGERVSTLVNEEQNPGFHTVDFNIYSGGRGIASGFYIYRIQAGEYVETKKMILLK